MMLHLLISENDRGFLLSFLNSKTVMMLYEIMEKQNQWSVVRWLRVVLILLESPPKYWMLW
jgi:hypothetical protein